MRWAIIFSVGLHLLALLALWYQDAARPGAPEPPPQVLAEMEFMLSDPSLGVPEADGETAAEPPEEPASAAREPEAARPESPVPKVREPSTSAAASTVAPPDVMPGPEPASVPVPTEPPLPTEPPVAAQAQAPPRTPPPAAPPPAMSTQIGRQPANPSRAQSGASASGRAGGLTDIVTGSKVVPPGDDPGHVNIPPRYPPEAARRGQHGRVVLNVLVATDGGVISVDVAESSGYALLDRAARDAVAKWRFRPGLRDGLAVPSNIPVPLVFILDN